MIRFRAETCRYRRVFSTVGTRIVIFLSCRMAAVILGADVGLKSVHGHKKPSRIERLLPLERLLGLFEERFTEPYFDPTAELTFSELAAALPDVQHADLEEALSHWVDRSGEKMIQTKLVDEDEATSRVWYVHGLHHEKHSV